MESPDEDDFWDDDFDEDWFADPPITYRQAVEKLHDLARGRTDVHVSWNGNRGPKDDARVVFTEAAGLSVQLRSATQLSDITRVISSAVPLRDRHAVWYPQDGVIKARIVGDFDQLYGVVAQEWGHRKSGAIEPDSALGRDLAGMLASRGVFPVSTAAAGSVSGAGRALRLVSVSQDLSLLYRARTGGGLFLALELSGISVSDSAAAEQELVAYGTSYLFGLAKATGVSMRLWNTEYRIGSRWESSTPGRIRFPQCQYDELPAALYAAGNSLARDPVERYLKYYQVLEFYMVKAVDTAVLAQGATRAAQVASPFAHGPQPTTQLSSEQGALDVVIDLAVTQDQLTGFLKGPDLFATLSDPRVIKDVQALERDATGGPVIGQDPRGDVSKRVYDIRNKIVHMKEGGARLNKPRPSPAQELLGPYSREARDLSADLRVVRFLAERAMEHWSTPLP